MAGFALFLPFGMVAQNQIDDIFLCLYVRDCREIINLAFADLAFVRHFFMQSVLQQQAVWSQELMAVPKHWKLPSWR
jgi:hypothetical protein